MAEQQRENCGALFVNDRKQKDTHPDQQGSLSITIDGQVHEFWISAWEKVSGSGTEYLSIAVKPKDEQHQRQQSGHGQQGQQRGSYRQGGQQGGNRGRYPS